MNINRKHINKPVQLIKKNGVKVIFDKNLLLSNSSARIFGDQDIRIGLADVPNNENILAIIAHEYGHYLTVRDRDKYNKLTLWNKLKYLAIYYFTKHNTRKEEKDAWRLGFAFLQHHNIPVTKNMKKIGEAYAKTYKK